MAVSKHRKNHKEKLKARKKKVIADNQRTAHLLSQLNTELQKVKEMSTEPVMASNPVIPSEPTPAYIAEKPGIFLTPTPNNHGL